MKTRQLKDLVSVGPAILADFEMLGVHSVAALAKRKPESLYRDLCRKTGTRQDPCVLDTFRAAVEQARDPRLPFEKCQWWYWSRVRKAAAVSEGYASGRKLTGAGNVTRRRRNGS